MNTRLMCAVVCVALFSVRATSKPHSAGLARCVNMWDEGCINDQLQGAGRDDDFVNGDFSPGKRSVGVRGGGWGAPLAEHGYGKLSGEYPPAPLCYELLAKLFNNAL